MDIIKELVITPLVLCMSISTDKFRLESNTSKTAAEGALFYFQQGQSVCSGYYSRKLTHAICNCSVTDLELVDLVCNIHSFGQLPKYQYFW